MGAPQHRFKVLFVSFALLAGLAPGRARARTVFQAQVSGASGVTDNLASRPSNPPAGQLGPEVGAFFNVTPRATVFYETLRTAQQLFYSLSVDLYPRHVDATAYGNRLGWSALFQPSTGTEVSLNAQAYQGRESTLLLQDGAGSTSLSIQPRGNVTSIRGELYQQVSFQVASRWQLFEEVLGNANHPLESDDPYPTSFSVAGAVGARRQWTRDTLELRVRPSYLLNMPPQGGRQHSLDIEPFATWHRDLTPRWSSELGAGMNVAFMLVQSSRPIWQPAARGAIYYVRDEGQVSLHGAHRTEANTFLGRLMLLEEARLEGSLPIGRRRHFIVALSSGYQFGRALDLEQGQLGDSSHAVLADASLTWRVWRSLLLSARYQFLWQRTSFGETEPLRYQRHLGLIGLTYVYPEVPALLARAGRGLRLIRAEQDAEGQPGAPSADRQD